MLILNFRVFTFAFLRKHTIADSSARSSHADPDSQPIALPRKHQKLLFGFCRESFQYLLI